MNETCHRWMIALGIVPMLWACGPTDKAAAPPAPSIKSKPSGVETGTEAEPESDIFSDVTVIPVPLPEADKRSLDDKIAIYLFSRAQDAAEAIRADLAPPAVFRTRTVLSGILAAKSRVPPAVFQKVKDYSDLFLLSDGPLDAWTGTSLRPRFIPGELAAAAQGALAGGVDLGLESFTGADLGANRLEQLDQFLTSLRPVLFGTSGAGEVPSAAKMESRQGSGTPAPEPVSQSGADAIRALIGLSGGVLGAEEQAPLAALADFLETGDPARHAAYLREWQKNVYDHELIAFFEGAEGTSAAGDASGRFEMIAAVMDTDRTPLVQKVAKKVDYFERNLPGNAMFKRPLKSLVPPSAGAYFVIAAAPWSQVLDTGAFTYPLPGMTAVSRDTKALLFLYAASAREAAFGEAIAEAFSPDKETLFLRRKWRAAALSAFLILKNVIGSQAGTRKNKGVNAPSQTSAFSGPLSILAEIHSDLVALHFAFDPVSVELGLIPEPECARALLAQYVSGFLEQSEGAAAPGGLRERQRTAVRVVTRGLLRSGAVSVEQVEGRFYVVVHDVEAARKSVEAQLAEAQRMISLGESGDAQLLIDTDGGPLPKLWREDAVQRLRAAGIRPKYAYLFPMLDAQKDAAGKIVDVHFTLSTSLADWIASRSRRFRK